MPIILILKTIVTAIARAWQSDGKKGTIGALAFAATSGFDALVFGHGAGDVRGSHARLDGDDGRRAHRAHQLPPRSHGGVGDDYRRELHRDLRRRHPGHLFADPRHPRVRRRDLGRPRTRQERQRPTGPVARFVLQRPGRAHRRDDADFHRPATREVCPPVRRLRILLARRLGAGDERARQYGPDQQRPIVRRLGHVRGDGGAGSGHLRFAVHLRQRGCSGRAAFHSGDDRHVWAFGSFAERAASRAARDVGCFRSEKQLDR